MTYIESLFKVPGSSLTIDNVNSLITGHQEENLHLEFKSGDYFELKHREDLTKAVASFANSDGGVLILGIKEKSEKNNGYYYSYAESIEGIIADATHTKESLENILTSTIWPKIDNLEIYKVEIEGKNVFILEIPKSDRAPHMASDHRYYKRHNFQKQPMENYEVEDAMLGRRKIPKLTSKFKFANAVYNSNFLSFTMDISICNIGKIMAKYVAMIINIKGIKTVKPPKGFHIVSQDQDGITLQYGPIEGASPVIIFPMPTEAETWTFIGHILFQDDILGMDVPVSISYRLLQEELPQTTGNFIINLPGIVQLNNGQSQEFKAPNEKFLY